MHSSKIVLVSEVWMIQDGLGEEGMALEVDQQGSGADWGD